MYVDFVSSVMQSILIFPPNSYMFDEPSSYLDVRQRLKAARLIRSLLKPSNFVIVVEHDLSVLDYLSDYICVLYGVPGAYGVVTLPFSVREGINIFLAGFVPTENLRFRDFSLTFKMMRNADEREGDSQKHRRYNYPAMVKTFPPRKQGESTCAHCSLGMIISINPFNVQRASS
jgi:translation initiation factor RLI1